MAGEPIFGFGRQSAQRMAQATRDIERIRNALPKNADGTDHPSQLPYLTEPVRNDTDTDLDPYSVLEIVDCDPVPHHKQLGEPDDADTEDEVVNDFILSGVAPTADRVGRFVIVQELVKCFHAGGGGIPDQPAEVTQAASNGPCWGRVQMISEDDEFADTIKDETGFLGSGSSGRAYIEWVQPPGDRDPATPDIALCRLSLGNPSGSGDSLFFLMLGAFSSVMTKIAQGHVIGVGKKWTGYNGPSYLDVGGHPSYPELLQLYTVRDSATFNGKLYAVGTFKVNPHWDLTNHVVAYDVVHFAERDFANNCWKEAGNHRADGKTTPDADDGMKLRVFGNYLYLAGQPRVSGQSAIERWSGAPSGGFAAVGATMLSACYGFKIWQNDPSGHPTLYACGSSDVIQFDVNGLNPVSIAGPTFFQFFGSPAPVQCLEVHDDGTGEKLYAGGGFRTMNGAAALGLCRYMGSAWERFNVRGANSGLTGFAGNPAVWCLKSFKGKLVYGGDCDGGGNAIGPANPLGCWDGATCASMPANDLSGVVVRDMDIRTVNGKQELVFVGGFDTRKSVRISGEDVNYSARYNAIDDAFHHFALSQLDGAVYDWVTLLNGDLLATGEFTGHLAYYHGGDWHTINNVPAPGRSICLATVNGQAGTAVIGGDFGLRLWNGSGDAQLVGNVTVAGRFSKIWQVMTSPLNATLIYVVGDFDSICGTGGNYCAAILSNTSSAWVVTTISGTPLTSDDGYPVLRCCAHDGVATFYVGGNFKAIGGVATNINYVARLNGGAWSAMNTGLAADVFKIACFTTSGVAKVYAAVNTSNPGYLRQWGGATWANFSPSGGATPHRRPEMLKVVGGNLYIDYNDPTDNLNRLASLASTNIISYIGCGIDHNKNCFSRPIRTVEVVDTGDGSEIHVGGDFTRIGEAGAAVGNDFDVILCIGILTEDFFYKPFLGGIGQMPLVVIGTSPGTASLVKTVRVLDVDDLGNGVVVAGGDFGMASEVQASYAAAVSTTGRAIPIGKGLGPIDNTLIDRGAHRGYFSADGSLFIGGSRFSEAYNDIINFPDLPPIVNCGGKAMIRYFDHEYHALSGGDVVGDGTCFSDFALTSGHADPADNGRPIVLAGHTLFPYLSKWDPVLEEWDNASTDSDFSLDPLQPLEANALVKFQGFFFCACEGYITPGGVLTQVNCIRHNNSPSTPHWQDFSIAALARAKFAIVTTFEGVERLIVGGDGNSGGVYPCLWEKTAPGGAWATVGPSTGLYVLECSSMSGFHAVSLKINGVVQRTLLVNGVLTINGGGYQIAYLDRVLNRWIGVATSAGGGGVGAGCVAEVGGKPTFGGLGVGDLSDAIDSKVRRLLSVGCYTTEANLTRLFGLYGAENPVWDIIAIPPFDIQHP